MTAPQHNVDPGNENANTERLDLPPHSVETEENLLGAILMNPEALHDIAAFLTEDDFYIVRHGWIWDAFLRLYERHEPIDYRTVAEELRIQEDPTGKHANKLVAIGGESYLNYLPENVPTALHAEIYGRVVERAAIRRRLIGAAGEISQLAYDEDMDIDKVIESAENRLFAVAERRSNDHEPMPLNITLRDVFDTVDIQRGSETSTGLPTGFHDLDKIIGGLQSGDVVIVAGRPGMGKSAWLQTTALNTSRQVDARLALFSLEMDAAQVTQRFISQDTGISIQDLRTGNLTEKQWEQFVSACGRLADLHIYIDDSPTLTPQALRAKCKRLYRQYGLDLIMMDYLQLMSAPGFTGKGGNRVNEIGYITSQLKALARELKIPVIAAAQLNRDVEKRADKRPNLGDLRESGSIENDADIVAFLYRDDVYHEDSERPNECDVIIAKQRNGPQETVSLLFQKDRTRFVNLRRIPIDLGLLSPTPMPESFITQAHKEATGR